MKKGLGKFGLFNTRRTKMLQRRARNVEKQVRDVWHTTNLSRRLDSFDEAEEDDGPGEQETQSHLPADRAKVMDAFTVVFAEHVATADRQSGHIYQLLATLDIVQWRSECTIRIL